jgi:hypothetical protein
MKAATTSLLSWLGDYDEVALPLRKEPNFFSVETHWEKGREHYLSNFPRQGNQISGEASVAYLDPQHSGKVAQRISQHLPTARLVAVLREPVSRLRSHYNHQVRMGRERRPFEEAITLDSAYVRRSLYGQALKPYLEPAITNPLLVIRYEDLVSPAETAWQEVTDFLGLPRRPHPARIENETSGALQYTRLLRRILDSPLSNLLRAIPRPVRSLGRPLLFRRNWQTDPRFATSEALSTEVLGLIEDEEKVLSELLDWGFPIWTRPDGEP